MSRIYRLICFTFTLLIGAGVQLHAQISQSPYTLQGLGDIQGMGLMSNESMGGVGIALGRPFYINNINPALLPYNTATSFDISLTAEKRDLSRDTIANSNSSADFNYLAFAFPLMRGRWTFSVGLKPYSVVDYSIRTTSNISGADHQANMIVEGTGGLNQAYFATGARFFNQLYLGVRAGYLFGAILDETSIEPFTINDEDTVFSTQFKSTYARRVSCSDMIFGGGAAYTVKLSDDFLITVGGIYDLKADISAKRLVTLEQRTWFENSELDQDTILFDDNGTLSLPSRFGVGISLVNGFKWAAGIDYTVQNWSEYRNYLGESENLKDTYKLSAGVEFIPNYNSVVSYFERVLYKAGFYYYNTPYSKDDIQVSEFGINFGAGLPMSGGSLINLSIGYGRRGFTDQALVKEDIFKFGLGITFNDQRWFIRRKYD